MKTNQSIQQTNLDQTALIREVHNSDQSTQLIVNRQQNFLSALFPSKLQRELKQSELKLAKTEMEFREKAFETAKTAQIEAIKEMYNQFLLKGKANIRRELLEYYTEQYNLLCDSINKEADYFKDKIQAEYAKIDSIKVKVLRDLEEKRILDMINHFHNTTDALISDFVHILSEKI